MTLPSSASTAAETTPNLRIEAGDLRDLLATGAGVAGARDEQLHAGRLNLQRQLGLAAAESSSEAICILRLAFEMPRREGAVILETPGQRARAA